MTAVRLPYLAAATATLDALPPRYLPKLSTSSRPTPTCCGYRSTPIRPMVSTSNGSGIGSASLSRRGFADTEVRAGRRYVYGFTPGFQSGQEYVLTYLRL